MRDRVLVYEDYGCASTDGLKRALDGYYAPRGIRVETTDAAAVVGGALDDGVLAFVMPGGAATPYRRKLGLLGNGRIASYVRDGGAYLGICAGAYYACSKVEFETDVPEICIVRDDGLLNLLAATAVGTLRKELRIRPYAVNEASSAAVELLWRADGEEHTVRYHGGPRFELHDPAAEVLAVYKDVEGMPPAVVGKSFGRGRAVLSGVHMEDRGEDLKKAIHALRIDAAEAVRVADRLERREASRQALFAKVMRALER